MSLAFVPSLRDSPWWNPTRHCRAGLQIVPSLRDWGVANPLRREIDEIGNAAAFSPAPG